MIRLCRSVEEIIYHTRAVLRGCQRPLVIADLPAGSYRESPWQAFRNAARLMAAGAQMVKLEGGTAMAETTQFLPDAASRSVPM